MRTPFLEQRDYQRDQDQYDEKEMVCGSNHNGLRSSDYTMMNDTSIFAQVSVLEKGLATGSLISYYLG